MHKSKYKINCKNFNNMYKMSQEIRGNIFIIENFCKTYQHVDDFYMIMPLIKYTNNLSDKLYNEFINIK